MELIKVLDFNKGLKVLSLQGIKVPHFSTLNKVSIYNNVSSLELKQEKNLNELKMFTKSLFLGKSFPFKKLVLLALHIHRSLDLLGTILLCRWNLIHGTKIG